LEKLVAKAKEYRMPALAITDHGNLFGAIDFYTLAMKEGVKPIIGCEVYVAPGSRLEKSNQDSGYEGASHITLLAKDQTGYKNLIKLVSAGYLEGFYYKPRIDRELFAQHSRGLIALSGCLNCEVAKALLDGDEGRAKGIAGWGGRTISWNSRITACRSSGGSMRGFSGSPKPWNYRSSARMTFTILPERTPERMKSSSAFRPGRRSRTRTAGASLPTSFTSSPLRR
jgi:hypothetical protein